MGNLMLQLQLTLSPSSTFRPRSIRCANDRQALFSRVSPIYDNLVDLLSLGQHRIWKRMAVSWTGAKMGDRVLDVCCGSGDLAFLLSEKVGSRGKVIGLDFSKEFLLIASSRQGSQNRFRNIEWVEGDALNLPFDDGWFDAITMGYGLRNVVNKHKAMQEIQRVLKAGSSVSILDFNKWNDPLASSITEWMIDNVLVPGASGCGLSEEYKYLKSSIREFLTEWEECGCTVCQNCDGSCDLPVSILLVLSPKDERDSWKELEKLALEVGFSTARHYEISGGLMGCLVATR